MAVGCCSVQIFTIWIDQFCLQYKKEDFQFQKWWCEELRIHYPLQLASILRIFRNFRNNCDMPDAKMNSFLFHCKRKKISQFISEEFFISISWNQFVQMTFFILLRNENRSKIVDEYKIYQIIIETAKSEGWLIF